MDLDLKRQCAFWVFGDGTEKDRLGGWYNMPYALPEVSDGTSTIGIIRLAALACQGHATELLKRAILIVKVKAFNPSPCLRPSMRRSTDMIPLAEMTVIGIHPAGILTPGGVPAAQAANVDQGLLRCQMPDLTFA